MIKSGNGAYPLNDAILTRNTLVTRSERAALVGWFARQGEVTQLEIAQVQSDLLRKSLATAKTDSEAEELNTFGCLIRAITLFRRRASFT